MNKAYFSALSFATAPCIRLSYYNCSVFELNWANLADSSKPLTLKNPARKLGTNTLKKDIFQLHDKHFVKQGKKFSRLFLILASIIGFMATCLPTSASASNYLYEYEISESLKEGIPEKEFIWLDTGLKRKTLALRVNSKSTEAKGVVVILPDLGHHPDWPNIIHDLRYYLPQHGWATLTIQPPVDIDLENQHDFEAAYQTIKQRVTAAIKYIKADAPEFVVLLGRGKSANYAIRYVAETQNTDHSAHSVVFVSAFDSRYLTTSAYMKSIATPMLDIFAENDHPQVLESAHARIIAARFAAKLKSAPQNLSSTRKVQQLALNKTGNLRYRQIIIPGATALFTAQTKTLLKSIRGWLTVTSRKKRVVAER